MNFSSMAYSRDLMNHNDFRTTPGSEEEARAQFKDMFDQVTAYINGTLIPQLSSTNTGLSGAERIGSAAIDGLDTGGTAPVSPVTVRDQIALLQQKFDNAVKNKISVSTAIEDGTLNGIKLMDRTVSTDKIADGAVTAAKLAGGIISASILSDKSIATDKIEDSAITGDKIATGAVYEAKLGVNSVTETKISDSNVTTPKIADSNVTTAKIADGNVTTAKIADGNVTESKIANGNVTAAKIADGNVTASKIADANVTYSKLEQYVQNMLTWDRTRKITVSSSDPSGGSDGDIWLKLV